MDARKNGLVSKRNECIKSERTSEFLLIGGAMVVGQVYRKIHPRGRHISCEPWPRRVLTLNHDKKKSCHSHGRIVGETSKSQRILKRTIVNNRFSKWNCLCTKKRGGEGERESERKQERGERERRRRRKEREKKKKKDTFRGKIFIDGRNEVCARP